MNKYHCLALGIIGIIILDALAIVVLKIDGTLMMGCATGIGGLIGYAFNKDTPPVKKAAKKVV